MALAAAPVRRRDDDDYDDEDDASARSRPHVASWLDDVDEHERDDRTQDKADDVEHNDGDEDDGDNVVIPWLPSDDALEMDSGSDGEREEREQEPHLQQQAASPSLITEATAIESSAHAQSEGDEDDETVADFADDWADEYLAMDTNESTTERSKATVPSSSRANGLLSSSVSRESDDQGLRKLFSRAETNMTSLRDEIQLVEQATAKAVSAALSSAETDANRTVPSLLMAPSRSFSGALPRHASLDAQAPAPAAVAEVRVHPIPTATAATDKTLERSKAAPLSPNSLKRANSVYVTPTSTSKVLMKRQDSLTTTVSRSQMLWNSDASRRSSRMLDEWKRKEIWHDFKRAEVNVAGPQGRTPAPVASKADSSNDESATGSRLESLLQTLRAEIHSSRTADKSVAGDTAALPPPPPSSAISNQLSSAFQSLGASGVFGSQSHERRHTMLAPSVSSAPADVHASPPTAVGCSRVEYEQLLQEKRALADELENRTRASVTDKELLRSLHDRVQTLEHAERENKFLKDEIQRHVMAELSATERLKTLGDQLALTTKSEEQLKLQTQQLFQQNQSLQSDLLEKIATEASKIQKMAHLSAEKETLMHELERNASVASKRQREETEALQHATLRRLLRLKRLAHLRAAMAKLQVHSGRLVAARTYALGVFAKAHRVVATKALAKAFYELQAHSARAKQQDALAQLQRTVDASKRATSVLAAQAGLAQLARVAETWRTQQLRSAFQTLERHSQTQHKVAVAIERGCATLHVLTLGRARAAKQRALAMWKARAALESVQRRYETALRTESELSEAKDCVFALSREKTKLEERLARAGDEFKRQTDQLNETSAELQVVKHGYVTTVIRDYERAWLRGLFTAWREQTHVALASKDLRLQVELAELRAAERDKYAKTVDDYNRVLRSDLERFQFFSQDKRIAVDVLTKKLLREEEKFKQMEERHVVLEERAHALRTQVAALVEWDGLELPLAMLTLAKDSAVRHLHELFLLHATATPDPSASSLPHASDDTAASPRLAMDALLRMIEYSTLLEATQLRRDGLLERIGRHFPTYALERGLLFQDFVVGLTSVARDVFRESASKSEDVKAFWASLLALVDPSRWDTSSSSNASSTGRDHLISGQSPWAGRLSDDILQNQEKLLAVLEHETAVVERAVMEKSSLKHTYPTSDHASVASTFYEYQCDPMLPPEPAAAAGAIVASSASSVAHAPTDMYANWYQAAQIRDLFLAFQHPLLKVLRTYSNDTRLATHGHQFCLHLAGVVRMLDDMKLYPTYLAQDAIHAVFQSLCDRDGVMTPQAFTLFLGSCALELYTKSLAGRDAPPAFALSPREILLSFFCDLGFLAESDAPPPARICLVGTEIEAILWSLFEYYATTTAGASERSSHRVADDERVAMTSSKFAKFMAEIAGAATGADAVFERVQRESRRATGTASAPWRMHFDEFYSAIAYVQEARSAPGAYASPGDAVRHWMQQTQ